MTTTKKRRATQGDRILRRLETLSDDESPRNRALVRVALAEPVEDLQHDLRLVSLALDGPDPEYALFVFSQVMRKVPATLRRIEQEVRS